MCVTAICLHYIEGISIYFAVTDKLFFTFVKFGERDPFKLTLFLTLSTL